MVQFVFFLHEKTKEEEERKKKRKEEKDDLTTLFVCGGGSRGGGILNIGHKIVFQKARVSDGRRKNRIIRSIKSPT